MNDLAGLNTTALDMSADAALQRARSIIPLLRSAAAEIDEKCELPPYILDAMFDAGLFKLALPKSLGGAELKLSEFVACVEAIAMGDAAAAWCMNQASGCSMASAYMDPVVAREIWGGKRDALAWGQGPGAKMVRAPGGWHVTGKWTFLSGSRHATWLGAACPALEVDGSPAKYADGTPIEHTALFPKSQTTLDGNWKVMGLKGTGSDGIALENLFVDDAHVVPRDKPRFRRETGTLYRFQATQLYASGFASVAMGIARAMLDDFIALAKGKTQAWSTDRLIDNAAIQNLIGHSDAAWKAARAGVHKALDDAWDQVLADGELSLDSKIQIRESSTYAIHICRDICHHVFHEAGSTAILNKLPFERRLRDSNSVSQQIQGRRTHFETVGQYYLGLTPSARWL